MPEIAVVILNWNGRAYLEKYLPSVIQHSKGCRIVVADNHSSDDSIAFVKQTFPEIDIIALPANYGFSEGYNRALSKLNEKYFILLNSDVEVTTNWIEPVVQLMEEDPRIAACQPKIKSWHDRDSFEYAGAAGGFLDKWGYPFCRGRIFDTVEKDTGQYDDIIPVFWATGACMFVRADAYREAGGMDREFFAHMEEVDLCWRFQNAGYKIMYCGHSTVYHVGGGTLHKSNPRKTYLNFRNGLAMMYKNLPDGLVKSRIFGRLLLDGLAGFKFAADLKPENVSAIARAHWHYFLNIKKYRSRRKICTAAVKKDISDTLYPGSIVWEYFAKGHKTFNQLEKRDYLLH
jgi:GT2 family glycosyltransferase